MMRLPLPLKWAFASDLPTYDFIKDYRLDEPADVEEAVENFIHKMEKDDFLAWTQTSKYKQGTDYFRHNGAGEMLVFTAAEFGNRSTGR